MRRLSAVALGLVLAVGSCELPKPPIPKLDADAGIDDRTVAAAGQAVGIQPATSRFMGSYRPPDVSHPCGLPDW